MEGLQQQVLLAAELQQQQQQQQQQMQGAGGVVREAERPIYAPPPICQGDFRTFTKTFKIYLSLQRTFNLRDQKSSLMLAASIVDKKISATISDIDPLFKIQIFIS